jgi:hypothetical protein
MAIATSYNITETQGARQDLSNQLRRVAPEQTPMYSTLNQSAAPKALFTEWLNEPLNNPDFGSPRADGTDASFNSDFTNEIADRVRIGNRVQQFDAMAAVSPISEMIDVAGPQSSLLAASKAKCLVKLKTDIEAAIGSNQAPATGTSSVGDKLGGIFHFGDPNGTTGVWDTAAKQSFRAIGAGVAQDGTASGTSRYDATTNGAISEANFRTILQTCFEGGNSAGTRRLIAGTTLMNSITDFSRATNFVGGTQARAEANINGTTMTLSVVELVTDYGILQVVPSLFLNRTSGNGLEAAGRNAGILLPTDDTVSLKVLSPISVTDLPDVGGGGDRFLTRTVLSLCVLNSRALASIV